MMSAGLRGDFVPAAGAGVAEMVGDGAVVAVTAVAVAVDNAVVAVGGGVPGMGEGPGSLVAGSGAINSATVDAATKALIKQFFDGNNDNTITSDEIRNSTLVGLILKTDVDLDGDGQDNGPNDGVSVGLGFILPKCQNVLFEGSLIIFVNEENYRFYVF